jgi:short-subunit dehydrogenase
MPAARDRTLAERYGAVGLVAGGAEGLGEAWVRRLLDEGLTTVLAVDLGAEALDALRSRLGESAADGRVIPVVADLGDAATWDALHVAIADHPPGILVCNAARADDGRFTDVPLEAHLASVAVNAAAPLRLLDACLPAMRADRRGAVVLTSSLSAAAAAPRLSVYAATKAYLLSLAQSLNVELRSDGIDVVAVMPGRIATPGFLRTRHAQTRAGKKAMPPATVVDAVVRGLGRAPLVIPGRGNQAAAFLLGRVLPRRTANDLMGRVIEKTAPAA